MNIVFGNQILILSQHARELHLHIDQRFQSITSDFKEGMTLAKFWRDTGLVLTRTRGWPVTDVTHLVYWTFPSLAIGRIYSQLYGRLAVCFFHFK